MIEQENINKKEKLQWHPAFCSATELELREDKENLEFIREYSLSQKPLQIDLMVIKKKSGINIKNEIGHIFKTHNIIEYKSPDDSLNIDDYYKSLGYVCLYKALAKHVDEIPLNELSLTLVHDSKPEKLIKILKENNHHITQKYKGIYYIEGSVTLPRQQIIVTSEIGKNHFLLRSLSKNFTIEEGLEFAKYSETITEKDDGQNLDSVFQVSVIANDYIFNRIIKENDSMNIVLEYFLKEKLAAKLAAAEVVMREEMEDKIRREIEDKIRREMEDKIRMETEERIKVEKELNDIKKKYKIED